MKLWLVRKQADILCLQEFFDDPFNPVFSNVADLRQHGGYHCYFAANPTYKEGRNTGIAIFSRYPMINKGEIFNENGFNRAIFADIVVHTDTFRIINAHLHSMQLGEQRTLQAYLQRIARGAAIRTGQSRLLLQFVASSPYPVVLCGDFNDMPGSYVYRQFSQHLKDAFTETGQGFGGTLNHPLLFFLRIDQQFCSPGLRPLRYSVHRELKASDHFPVEVEYGW